MPRTSQYVSVHNTLAQRPATMETGIVDGIELAADICQSNRFALHLKLSNRSRGDFIRLCCSRKRHLVFTPTIWVELRPSSDLSPIRLSGAGRISFPLHPLLLLHLPHLLQSLLISAAAFAPPSLPF